VAGIENLTDARYASAVLVNATRGRFFEPAPPRSAFVGLRVLHD
jgi:iron complex outermembrane receptor protein